MADINAESRYTITSACTSASTIKLPQPSQIDVYERDTNSIAVIGTPRLRLIETVTLRMALELDKRSTSQCTIFTIKYSQSYKELHLYFKNDLLVGHKLVSLDDTLVSNDEL
jgi:hypothetical protein